MGAIVGVLSMAVLGVAAFVAIAWYQSDRVDPASPADSRLIPGVTATDDLRDADAVQPVAPADPIPPGGATSLFGEGALDRADAMSFDRFLASEKLAEGIRYYFGEGVAIDDERARRCFEEAAAYEGRAAFLLAHLYENGRGVVPDDRMALEWLHRSVRLGYPQAQYVLGMLYLEGRPGLVTPDAEGAYRLLAAAASQGHEAARETLGRLGSP
ncbi:MAG: sel1 repeat family protein [Acidobacteria bacterium]|nr:sel1 repeat family protein [Acidobacteriota bacterium]